MDIGNIRAKAVDVVERAAAIFATGTSARRELDVMAKRLRDGATVFRSGLDPDEIAFRAALAEVVRHGEAAMASHVALAKKYDLADFQLESLDLEKGTRAARAALDCIGAEVTYDDVMRVLNGSWSDSEIVAGIADLKGMMAEPESAASPGP